MAKIAFVFPGQGSQHVGMGQELYKSHPSSKDTFEKTDKALEEMLSDVIFEGPEEALTLTQNAQPAILTTSIAAWRLLDDAGIKPDVVAGHSLGEYSAIVAAGGLTQEQAAIAVRKRGAFMQRAVPVGVGAMAALLGLDTQTVEKVCKEAAGSEILSLANINSAGQIVVAGHSGAVERAIELAKENGAKRAIPLQVSAPFHCALMKPAQEAMSSVLNDMEFSDLSIPLINNADVAHITGAEEVRKGLVKQIVAPVRWLQTMEKLIDLGIDTLVEIGPGKVLSGLMKRTDRSITLLNVEDVESLTKTISHLKG